MATIFLFSSEDATHWSTTFTEDEGRTLETYYLYHSTNYGGKWSGSAITAYGSSAGYLYCDTPNLNIKTFTLDWWYRPRLSAQSHLLRFLNVFTSSRISTAPSHYRILSTKTTTPGQDGYFELILPESLLTLHTWHHIAISFDYANNMIKLFVNGDLVDSHEGNLTTGTFDVPLDFMFRGAASGAENAHYDEIHISDTVVDFDAVGVPLNPYGEIGIDVSGEGELPYIYGESEMEETAKERVRTLCTIHSDTTDDSTTFTDSWSAGRAVTATTATHSTDQAKFGATSIKPGSAGGSLVVVAPNLVGPRFTYDWWMYLTARGVDGDILTLPGLLKIAFEVSLGRYHLYVGPTYATYAGYVAQSSWPLEAWIHVIFVANGYGGVSFQYSGSVAYVPAGGSTAQVDADRDEPIEFVFGNPGSPAPPVAYFDELHVSNGALDFTGEDFPTEPWPDYDTLEGEGIVPALSVDAGAWGSEEWLADGEAIIEVVGDIYSLEPEYWDGEGVLPELYADGHGSSIAEGILPSLWVDVEAIRYKLLSGEGIFPDITLESVTQVWSLVTSEGMLPALEVDAFARRGVVAVVEGVLPDILADGFAGYFGYAGEGIMPGLWVESFASSSPVVASVAGLVHVRGAER